MEFENRKTGDAEYVVCRVSEESQIDTVTKGMLLNNKIDGVAAVDLTEIDGIQEYRFDVTKLCPVTEIYEKSIRKQGLLTVLMTITGTIIRCRDYMIPENTFVLSEDNIYVNLTNCQTTLICLPAEQEDAADLKTALTAILTNCRTDAREPSGYVYYLIDFLKQKELTADAVFDMLGRVSRNEINIPERPVPMKGAAVSEPSQVKRPAGETRGSVLFDSFREPSQNAGSRGVPDTGSDVIRPLSSLMNEKKQGFLSGIRPLSDIIGGSNASATQISAASEIPQPLQETVMEETEEYEETGLLVEEEDTADTQSLKKGYLIRISNEERVEITGMEFVIGRSEEQADYAILGNRWISNMHASIISTREGCYLRDLGSMNHTYLNDNQVFGKNEVLIPDGAVIRLGNERFRFRYY